MTTFLSILCVVLIVYLIGAVVSFIHHMGVLTDEIDTNSSLGIIFALFAFLMSVFAGVFWPVIIYVAIEEYFEKRKSK